MAAVSMFFGIIIDIHRGRNIESPHFHASYQNHNAIYGVDGTRIDGRMPRTQTRLITAWAEIHREELLAEWELALRDEPLFRIDPLK